MEHETGFACEKKVIVIGTNFFGGLLAFCIGAAIAAGNYAFSRYILKRHASKYAGLQIVRQLVQVGYLVLLFALGGRTPWDTVWLLVGGALGVTLPMLWFTYRLVKLNDSMHRKEESTDG